MKLHGSSATNGFMTCCVSPASLPVRKDERECLRRDSPGAYSSVLAARMPSDISASDVFRRKGSYPNPAAVNAERDRQGPRSNAGHR